LEAVLELKDISKRFPAVLANDHISLSVNKQEVFAIVGENGAGKTTLMNIIYGLYQPDSGQILVRGKEERIGGPAHAIALGIGMVHQHFMLVPVFTVAENVVLGMEPTKAGGILDLDRAKKEVADFSKKYGLQIDPDARVQHISVGMQQRVEIIKALFRGAEILILDEPTAVLTPLETEELFETIRALISQGKTVIFISHKLKEVLAIADRIAVLRGGKVSGLVDAKDADEALLARMMVGRDVVFEYTKTPAKIGEIALEAKNLVAKNDRGLEAVKNISFQLRQGEIIGIAGVEGNGQTELVEVLTGMRSQEKGEIYLAGQSFTKSAVNTLRHAGMAHIPQDRQRTGLVLPFNVAENLVLGMQRQSPFAKGRAQNRAEIENFAIRKIQEFDIRPQATWVQAKSLSGGNQQKVIVAREISTQPKVMIASQPTRGLDVGATEFVHNQLLAERDSGKAILLFSLELDEIMSLSDRIMVMYGGEIVAEFQGGQVTREEIGLYMLGLKKDQAIPGELRPHAQA
jgi:simple sugar transport system ATP-binding protein